MGLFEKIFPNAAKKKIMATAFRGFTAYQPTFTSWSGALYESELVRAAIDARARHISKLAVRFDGAAKPRMQTALRKKPNGFQTWSQFLYRLSTILDMQNTAFILPVIDDENEVRGIFPALPSSCEVVETKDGERWIRYHFASGDVGAVEMDRCGIMTKFQYRNDFFGEKNTALNSTLKLIDLQNQGISEGIKSSASFRFIGQVANFGDPDDVLAEQKRFTEQNMAADAGQVLLYPNTWKDMKQITSNPFTVPTDQVALIQKNVCNYFGVNEDVLQNSAIGDKLDGFFDGAIEPFAIQLSEVMTSMLFTDYEQGHGSRVTVTANRLQYMTTSNKISFVKELADRGLITINEARELLNYPDIGEAGERLPIRGEYKYVGDDEDLTKDPEGEENGNEE